MSPSQRPSSPLLALALSACAMGSGCLAAEPDGAPAEASVAANQDTLLILGPGLAPSGDLERIAANFHPRGMADLAGARRAVAAGDDLQLLSGVRAVAFDLNRASDEELAAAKPVLAAAMKAGVPLVIQNAGDPDRLSAAIGVGIPGDLVVVTSEGPNRYHLHVYGDQGEGNATTELAATEASDPAERALDVTDQILGLKPELRVDRALSTPTTGYKYYLLDFPEERKALAGSQVATIDLDFELELVRDDATEHKVVFIRPVGSGSNPNQLTWDGPTNRGYFQESQSITITPPGGNVVALYAHAPSSPNATSSYTSSTGWSIGVSGDGPQLGYSASNLVTTSIPDFTMVNNTSGQVASWTFAMSRSERAMFYDVFPKNCQLHGLPALAKSNLKPEFEVLYRASSSFTGTGTFVVETVTKFQHLWRTGNFWKCSGNRDPRYSDRIRGVTIDFGAI